MSDSKDVISIGADLGTKTGCLVSVLYTGVSYVFFLAISGLVELLTVGVPLLGFAYMIIIAPVLLLGAITGAILGLLSKTLASRVSERGFIQIGVLICLILLVAMHTAFFVFAPLIAEEDSGYYNKSENEYSLELASLTPTQAYLFFIGFPSIIYIVSGGWVSRRLYLIN